jgi:hypothetical protein
MTVEKAYSTVCFRRRTILFTACACMPAAPRPKYLFHQRAPTGADCIALGARLREKLTLVQDVQTVINTSYLLHVTRARHCNCLLRQTYRQTDRQTDRRTTFAKLPNNAQVDGLHRCGCWSFFFSFVRLTRCALYYKLHVDVVYRSRRHFFVETASDSSTITQSVYSTSMPTANGRFVTISTNGTCLYYKLPRY